MKKAKVYFTEKITPEAVIRMYQMLGKGTAGKGCGKGSLRRKGKSELSAAGIFEADGRGG